MAFKVYYNKILNYYLENDIITYIYLYNIEYITYMI